MKINGIDTQIVFKPLNYIIEGTTTSTKVEDDMPQTIDQPAVDEDDATEKVKE